MKKLYLILLSLNNLAISFILIKYLDFLDKSLINNLIIISGVILFLSFIYASFRKKRKVDILDMISISTYMVFVILILFFSIIMQNNNTYYFTMFYHTLFIIIPSVIFNIYNII